MKNKIDTTRWREFKIYEIFTTLNVGNKRQVPTGASISKKDLVENGSIPRISVTGVNNGIVGYYDYKLENKSNYRVYRNFISVSFLGTIFYQEGECSLDMKVHCLKLIEKELNKYCALYLVSVLRASLKESSYSDQISSTVLPDLTIKLPIDNNGKPDWEYMEQYMKNIEKHVNESLKGLKSCSGEKNSIKSDLWGSFVIEDIFKIKRPKARSQSNYEEGEIPFVASGNYNNGVLKHLKPKENELLDKGNCITLSPVDGSAFYQKKDFLGRGGAGSSIILLYNKNLNENNGIFIATIIHRVCNKYGYNDMGSQDSLKKEVIKLPMDKSGNPDWDYMEQYIKQLLKKEKSKLQYLKLM